jgi:hypothetical protein
VEKPERGIPNGYYILIAFSWITAIILPVAGTYVIVRFGRDRR